MPHQMVETPTSDPTPFELLRAEARAWIVTQAYNGRDYGATFEAHESHVSAPSLARADDFTPLPLPSLVDTPYVSYSPEQSVRNGSVSPARIFGALSAAVLTITGVYVIDSAAGDLVSLIPGAAGAVLFGRNGFRNQTPQSKKNRHRKNLELEEYAVVPEVAYVFRVASIAAERLVALHAGTNEIVAAERAYEAILRDIPRLPIRPFSWAGDGKRLRMVNSQSPSVAYGRIMNTGAEVLLLLRAAEEKEYALSPQTTRTGPWTRLTLEPVVVDMVQQATVAQGL